MHSLTLKVHLAKIRHWQTWTWFILTFKLRKLICCSLRRHLSDVCWTRYTYMHYPGYLLSTSLSHSRICSQYCQPAKANTSSLRLRSHSVHLETIKLFQHDRVSSTIVLVGFLMALMPDNQNLLVVTFQNGNKRVQVPIKQINRYLHNSLLFRRFGQVTLSVVMGIWKMHLILPWNKYCK